MKNKCKHKVLIYVKTLKRFRTVPRDFGQVISKVFCIKDNDDERQETKNSKKKFFEAAHDKKEEKKKCKSKLFHLKNYRSRVDRLIPICMIHFTSCPQTLFEGVIRMNVFIITFHFAVCKLLLPSTPRALFTAPL